jgi:phage terminase Nu1 subunit (DNA packaging protein)
MPEIVTKAALAEELQCAKSHISKLISRGMPVRDAGNETCVVFAWS